ncbi:transposase-like protein [Bradyrhizobium diazoefficiens]
MRGYVVEPGAPFRLVFAEKYRAKYSRVVECLAKDRDALLAFYDFPAEHWNHLRTTTPIETWRRLKAQISCPR